MSVYVIIEDTPDNFQALVDIIGAIDKKSYILPRNTIDEIKAFRKACLEYLINPDGEKETEKLKSFISAVPDYFIVDFSLINFHRRKIDNWGGVLRQKFIKKYYSGSQVIMFSVYSKNFVTPFMEPSDKYLSKLIPNSNTDFKESWKKSLSYYLRKEEE